MVTINVVGVGGTGSWLIPPLVRFISEGIIHIYDPDIVEFKNTLRQNFTYIDIGSSKVQSIRRRYSTLGCQIKDKDTGNISENHFQKGENQTAIIMISCVDNILTRRVLVDLSISISVKTETPIILIDSGNEQISGNVYLNLFMHKYDPDEGIQYSKILMPSGMIELLNRKTDVDRPRISCANLQEQTVVANYRMAAEILNMLMNIGIKDNILNLQNIDINYLWQLVESGVVPNAHYVSFRNQYESSINVFTSNNYRDYLKEM